MWQKQSPTSRAGSKNSRLQWAIYVVMAIFAVRFLVVAGAFHQVSLMLLQAHP